ncbi:MAG: 16S rRNA processing protein RimM [Oleispira sp.]|jgi:16S rRNA processing protein RimM
MALAQQSTSISDSDVTIVGKVTTAFGIKGWVKIHSFTDPMNGLLDYKNWLLKVKGQWRFYKVKEAKPQGKGIVAKFEDIDDRDLALALSQTDIAVRSTDLPQLAEDEFYWSQLVGLIVVNKNGELLGKIDHLFNSGAPHDVMSVKGYEGSLDQQERLIPYVDAVIGKIDLDAGEMQVDWEADF